MLSHEELYTCGMKRIREADALDLLDLGAETKSQNRLNREYLDALTLEMRLMDSAPASTASTLLGREVSYPIQCGAIAEGRLLNRLSSYWQEPCLEEIAEAVAEAGTWLWVGGLVTPPQLQRLMRAGAPVVRLVKPFSDDGRSENAYITSLLKDAEDRGCVAVGMDIDVFYRKDAYGPKTMDEMRRFVEVTSLPFIVKGVLSVHDALKCREIGAKAIVVSHHGGEALDYAVPILRVLPDIKRAVPDLTIFIDSGFRRGTDILKALALGADAVCVVTILLIAYAGYGRRGVADMLRVLAEELRRNMSICGCRTIAGIDPSIVWLPHPDPQREK